MRVPIGAPLQGGSNGSITEHRHTPERYHTMHKFIDEKQVAVLLHVSVKSLQGWRYRGAGPKFAKFGRSVRYAMAELEDFVLAAQRTSTSDPGRGPILLSQLRAQQLRDRYNQPGRALERAQATVSRPSTNPPKILRPPTRRRHGAPRLRIRGGPSA